jgi:hypothetical protein
MKNEGNESFGSKRNVKNTYVGNQTFQLIALINKNIL